MLGTSLAAGELGHTETQTDSTATPRVRAYDGDRIRDGREVRGIRIRQKVIYTRAGDTYWLGKRKSNPLRLNTDRDRLPDRAEITGNRNKWDNHKSDPTHCDTDRGGVSDGREIRAGSDPSDFRSGPKSPQPRAARWFRTSG